MNSEELSMLLMKEEGIELTSARGFQSSGHLRVPFGAETIAAFLL